MRFLSSISQWLDRTRCAAKQRRPRKSAGPRLADHYYRLDFEILEDRCLMSGWMPANGTQTSNRPAAGFPGGDSLGTIGQALSGRISDILVSSDYDGQHLGHQAMLLAASGGGIWWSNNFGTDVPTWTARTDSVGTPAAIPSGHGAYISSMGSLAIDPNNPQIIYAGAGARAEAGHGSNLLA